MTCTRPQRFWGDPIPCEHLLEVYQDEGRFRAGLVDFADAGLRAGEAVIVIATAAHRASLEAGLQAAGHDLDAARAQGRYVALDAAYTLSRFMVEGQPDPRRFEAVIGPVIDAARGAGRPVRAFGEMVALLWADGQRDATVRLERLWNGMLQRRSVALLCAYPRIGATREIDDGFARVCAEHSQLAFT